MQLFGYDFFSNFDGPFFPMFQLFIHLWWNFYPWTNFPWTFSPKSWKIGVKDYFKPISYFTKVIENMKDYKIILEYVLGLYSKNLRKCYTTIEVTRSNHCFVYRLTSIAWQCKLDHSYTKNGGSIMQTTSRTRF
jgi:hypothetical protein